MISPQKDFCYDVADYCDINPEYGTLANFDVLITQTHARGMKLMIDIVSAGSGPAAVAIIGYGGTSIGAVIIGALANFLGISKASGIMILLGKGFVLFSRALAIR